MRARASGIGGDGERNLGKRGGGLGQGLDEAAGQAMGEGDRLMRRTPSRFAETVVAIFVPPGRREEVLGDLYERFHSPLRYAADALHTVPLVILSKMRRITDPQVLL